MLTGLAGWFSSNIVMHSKVVRYQHVSCTAAELLKEFNHLKLMDRVTLDILPSIYNTCIHSHLNYIIFLMSGGHQNKLFVLQKRAVRLLCGVVTTFHLVHFKNLLTSLGALSLPSLYVLHTF